MTRIKGKTLMMVYVAFVLLFSISQVWAAPATGVKAVKTVKSARKATTGSATSPATTVRSNRNRMVAQLPRLSVTAFKKAVPAGTMVTTLGGGSPSSTSPPPSIDLGEEIELYWSISYENVRNVRVSINGRSVTGEAHTASDGTPWMAGRVTYRPSNTTTYNLVATAQSTKGAARSLRAQKSLRVTVKKPVLRVLEPEVDQNTLTIKFFARNAGSAVFRPTPINVSYQVDGGTLASGSFVTPRMEIRRNQRVELGQITLPDRNRAFRNDSIRIRVEIGASYVLPLRVDRRDFTHRWTRQRATINNAMLRLLGMATTSEIVIDNWDETAGSGNWIRNPFQENACLVNFSVAGESSSYNFTLPYFDEEKTGGPLGLIYRTFLRNIRAYHRGDSDLFSISGGKLQISLDFPGRDPREIKIGRVGRTGSRRGKWKDDAAPDINLSAFTVNIQLTPAVRSGQFTYTDVDVAISGLRADFPGGWSWLNAGFQSYATRTVRNTLDSALTNVLSSGSIKNAIVEGISGGISSAGVNITRIISVRGSGSTITIEYL